MSNERAERAPTAQDRGLVYFAKGLDAQAVTQRAEAVAQSKPAFWLSFRPDRSYFERWDPRDELQQVALWPEGRVFGAEAEVRWEKRGGTYAAWVLTESENWAGNLEAMGFRHLTGTWTANEHKEAPIFLWGSYNQARRAWIEVKVPREQHYPAVAPAPTEQDTEKLFARLRAVYYHAENGAVEFTRLAGVSVAGTQ